MIVKLFAYKPGSKSAAALAEGLGIVQLNHAAVPNPKRLRRVRVVINWGSSKLPDDVRLNGNIDVINESQYVAGASNKLTAFQAMEEAGVSIPEWTTDRQIAESWETVCVRHKLNGHSAEGLEILPRPGDGGLPNAPLYVKYIPKKEEYRVHVVDGEVIDIQRKALRQDELKPENPDWKIRNLDGGFIFVRNDLDVPVPVTEEAQKAIDSLGLTFGAVDIIWNAKQKKAYALEVNTAPGLQGTTLDNYINAFKEII